MELIERFPVLKSAARVLMLSGVLLAGASAKQGLFFDPTVPVFGTPLKLADGQVLARGLLVRAGKGEWVAYDPELLRPAYWFQADETKEPVSMEGMAQASWYEPTKKGSTKWPLPQGTGMALAPALPGIGADASALASDPRPTFAKDLGRGGLQDSGRIFSGYRIAGETGVLSYEDKGVKVQEWFEADHGGGGARLSRHLVVAPGETRYFLVAAGAYTLKGTQEARGGADNLTILSNHPGLKLEQSGGQLVARLEASKNERRVSLCYTSGSGPVKPTPVSPVAKSAKWGGVIESAMTTAAEKGPGWEIDRLGLPAKNPWERRMRPADFAFLSDDRVAVVTFEGDVWLADLVGKSCKWRRIAGGLCEPMSIAQVNGVLQVFTRNGVIRLRDDNGDGEIDSYENFCSLMVQTSSARGYPLDMRVNAGGETFCAIGGIVTNEKSITAEPSPIPHSGTIMRISADGKKLAIVGKGAREPFFDIDPATGHIAMSDQQGNYVPASGIFPVVDGSYYGFGNKQDTGLTPPVAWIPHEDDTSSASPVWVRKSAFKEWDGAVIDVSYGTGRLFLVRPGDGWPAKEGAVVPLQIETGIPLLHMHVHPGDGSLWMAGLRVYDSKVQDLEGIGRLRRTTEPLATAVDARIVKDGVVLRYAGELDNATVIPDNVQAKEWQYRRSATYGSPRLTRAGATGSDPVATGGTFLSKDGRAVFIHIPGLKPTMQMQIDTSFALKGAKAVPGTVYLTVSGPPVADWTALGFETPKLDASVAKVHQKASTGPASAEAGKELATRYGCIACHSVDGATVGHSGPTWKGLLGAKRVFKDGSSVTADEAYIRESILDPGKKIVKGYELGMGSYAGVLGDSEIESVVLYIKSLK
ncbi:cytochrome c [Luteolibacter sp. LG18]|uniref:c-type cytochrome n=1 Tax=Luteolibacter sp. LG18 TaxID=2819286 RepID=UPI002B2BF16A|nr:hypothetical protein llg_32170 [Luteolibacter sp. LG18]